jgi:hypothetical protein
LGLCFPIPLNRQFLCHILGASTRGSLKSTIKKQGDLRTSPEPIS